MAKQRARQPVQELPGPVQLQPQAHGVDTFHQTLTPLPQTDTNSALELAQALSTFRPSLNRYLDLTVNDSIKEGQQYQLLHSDRESNRAALKGAVDRGEIPAGDNPWFRKGQRMQQARINAEQYAASAQEAFAKWGGKNSDKPEENDVTAFMQGHLQEFIKGRDIQQDGEFQDVFMPMANAVQGQVSSQYTAYRVNKIEKDVIEGTGTEIGSILDNKFIYKDPSAAIAAVITDHVKNGADGSVLNKVAVEAITQKAIEDSNLSVLDHLDSVDTGNGRLGKTQYAREARLRAETHIIADMNQNSSQTFALANKQRAVEADKVQTEFIDALQADPGVDVRPYELRLAAIDPEKTPHLRAYQQQFLTPHTYEDPVVIANIYKDLSEGKLTLDDIVAHAAAGHIDPGTIANLNKEKNILEKAHSSLSDPAFRQVSGSMVREMTGDPLQFDLHKVEKAEKARYSLSVGWAKYADSHPDAPEVDKLKYLHDLTEQVRKTFPDDTSEKPKEMDLKSTGGLKAAIDELNQASDPSQTTLGRNAESVGLTIEEYVQALSASAKKKPSK